MGHSIDELLRQIHQLRDKLKTTVPRTRYETLQHEHKLLKSKLLIYRKEMTSLLSQLDEKEKLNNELLRIIRNRSNKSKSLSH